MKNETGFREGQVIHLANGRRLTISKLAFVPEVTPFGGWWVEYRDHDPKRPRQKVSVTCTMDRFKQLVERRHNNATRKTKKVGATG